MFNKEIVLKQLKNYDSFYLYDENIILQNMDRLKSDFSHVQFLYSLKTNSHPQVVKTVLNGGFGADAASLAEVKMAMANDVTPQELFFSAPGKTAGDIEEALGHCLIIADSLSEVNLIQNIAAARGVTAEIGIRINPNFGFFGGGGVSSKFGIDEDQVYGAIPLWKSYKNVRITGIHVHLRSQELSAETIKKYYEKVFVLALKIQNALNQPLEFINLGSGIGIPYAESDEAVDTAYLGKAAAEIIEKNGRSFPKTRIFIETGRFVAGKSGIYVTKVLDKKVSFGKTFVILKNTFNGFIRPSVIQMVLQYSAVQAPESNEPLFTSKGAFQMIPITDNDEMETVTLVGNLCTAADVIARGIEMKKLSIGDAVVITNAGSYAAVLSPMQFSSQEPPAQLFLTKEGEVL